MIFTISARRKPNDIGILDYLSLNFPDIPLSRIDSVFGFVERSTFYGGRPFLGPELTDEDVKQLNDNKIGLRIPFTNHHATRKEYEEHQEMLTKYHKKGNAIILTNDELTQWIRKDFPRYRIEASVIKNIDTHKKIEEAYELYDTVVLPMAINQDHEFLKKVKSKKRITLFANAGCALTCPSKICYPSISKINKYEGGEILCSKDIKDRNKLGMIDFDLDELVSLGFTRFKLLRSRSQGRTGY